MAINGTQTDALLHFDAQQLIKSSDSSLQLKLSRYCDHMTVYVSLCMCVHVYVCM